MIRCVLRGGAWFSIPEILRHYRSANRLFRACPGSDSSFGFRLVLPQ
jgi:hypothetical protein